MTEFEWPPSVQINEAREIVRLGELQMEDIRELAISGDSRAGTISAALSAVAAGLVAAAVAVLQLKQPNIASIAALLCSATFFATAAGFALGAAFPSDFGIRGFDPAKLIGLDVNEFQIVKWNAEALVETIAHNTEKLRQASDRFRLAYFLSAGAIAVPALILAAASCFS